MMEDKKQEPVGKFAKFTDGIWREVTDGSAGVPLYTAPQRTWVGLTDKERNHCLVEADPCEALADPEAQQLMIEIEAKLKKNT